MVPYLNAPSMALLCWYLHWLMDVFPHNNCFNESFLITGLSTCKAGDIVLLPIELELGGSELFFPNYGV